ncbi:transposase [Dactylosporangium sp. NPDC048998]|uniref:transposase n=1 Tax=Dactylosporangium sp. NPDC048998 TaxID=3363976 RepID=UPI003723BE7B
MPAVPWSRRPRPCGLLAGGRGGVHRPRADGAVGPAGAGAGTRHRRDLPGPAQMGPRRGHRWLAEHGRPLARRVRRPCPAGKGCSGRSRAAPPRQSSTGWTNVTRPGATRSGSSRSTCARSSSPPSVLPRATLVVDHFHLVQLANQTLTEVRRRVSPSPTGAGAAARATASGSCVTCSPAPPPGCVASTSTPLPDELASLPPAIGNPIITAWHAKEDLLDLLATARTHPDREQVRDLLYRFYRRCADASLPELERLAMTAETWWPEILAFLHTGITNAGSEGTNRVIKTIARDAYGFRNPVNQRLRTRTATTRKARGHLDPR